MTKLNKTMDRINNRLDNELCNRLSSPACLKEFVEVTRYDNVDSMLKEITPDFLNTSINNFDYTSYVNYLDTIDGFVNLDMVGLDEPIITLEYNGEILNADTDYFNIIFSIGFEDSLNNKGKQVLKDYKDLLKLLNQFKNDKAMDTLEMVNDYATDWQVIDDYSMELEKYAEDLN